MNMIQRFKKIGLAALLVLPCLAQPDSFDRKEIKLLGSLDYGQTSAPARLSVRPPYSAYDFNAKPGDRIEITVHGEGTLQAFLTDAEYKKVAGGSTHFSYTFDPASKPGTFYILVSETHHQTSSFTVDLERPSTVADYLSCSADSDCVAVDRAGCCHNGYKDAVNASQLEAYRAANACQDAHHMCPMFMIVDKRVARCDTTLKRCQMVQPEQARQ